VTDSDKMKELFYAGLGAYHHGNYFDAHEYWEELWSDYHIEDRQFIQGLLQLSVSFFHIQNGNLNGAKGLIDKSIEKFRNYTGFHRNIDVNSLKKQMVIIQEKYQKMSQPSEFDWDLIPELI